VKRPTRWQLDAFVVAMHQYLGQPRWEIVPIKERLEDNDEDPQPWAETRYDTQGMFVQLWWSDVVLEELPIAKVREVAVHEAMHAIHSEIDFVTEDVSLVMHSYEWSALSRAYHRARERMVAQLAYALSDSREVKRLWKKHCGGGA
jgi:hypothetical protein